MAIATTTSARRTTRRRSRSPCSPLASKPPARTRIATTVTSPMTVASSAAREKVAVSAAIMSATATPQRIDRVRFDEARKNAAATGVTAASRAPKGPGPPMLAIALPG